MVSRTLRWLAVAGMLAVPLGAPGGASAQVLQVAVDQSPAGLDPHLVTAFSSFQIVNGPIYEGLTSVDAGLKVVPALAVAWNVSADGKTYTFKLRPGVRFHDGSAMEATDVIASYHRVMDKAIGSPLASRLGTVTEMAAADAQTVVLTLSEPTAPLLSAIATIAIVPRAMEHDKDSLQKQPDGTGPFMFKEWQPNGFILLARNPQYWRAGLPKLEGVKFNIVPESATRQVGIASGQYAMLPNIDPATALQLKGKPGVKLEQTLELSYTLLGMNAARPPFDNPLVREAVNYALDRQQMIDAALFGAGVPAGPLSPALKDWALPVSDFACYKTDPAKARALLEQAGLKLPVAVTITVLPRQDIKDLAQVAQAQMDKAGFKVTLKNVELGAFIQAWRNGGFEMFASANGGSVDPDDYFYRTFRTGGSTNVFKYSNPGVDGLLDKARAMTDPAARKAAYDQVQRVLACQGPVAHLAYAQLFTALRSGVSRFQMMANRSLASLVGVTVSP
jgi:peptide/nickel transport system substrate-binding protein